MKKSFPYKHSIYNPTGAPFSGDIYSKMILEKEYELISATKEELEKLNKNEIDLELEKSVAQTIYSQFGEYLDKKGHDTPILHELVDIYIGQKLMAIRMNKLFYQYGVMELKLVQDPETGMIKEFYRKTPIIRDFNELNKNASDTLKQINDIIDGLKINVNTTSLTLQEVLDSMEYDVIDTEANEKGADTEANEKIEGKNYNGED